MTKASILEQDSPAPRHAGGALYESILVIDDHPLFCDALALTLKSVLSLREIRTANTLSDGLAELGRGYTPDAVVLDLNLPDVSGVGGLLNLRRRLPGIPVVIVSALADNRTIAAVLAGGAAGFIPKDSDRDTLVQAFRKIWDGELYTPETYTPPENADSSGAAQREIAERLSSLTPQQTKILELLCEGKLNKQIAFELSIAETTVKAHVTAILRKLGVHSRTQAALISKDAQFSSAQF